MAKTDEDKKKAAQQAVLAAIKSGAAYKEPAAAVKANSKSGPAKTGGAASKGNSAKTGGTANKGGTSKGGGNTRSAPVTVGGRTAPKPTYSIGELTNLTRAQPIIPRLTRADGSTWEAGQPLPTLNRSKLLGGDSAVLLPDNRRQLTPLPYAPKSTAEQKLVQNSLKWHTAKTQDEKNTLFQENEHIRKENNWSYDPTTGTTHSWRGNLSEPVQVLHAGSPARRAESVLAGEAGMATGEFWEKQRNAAGTKVISDYVIGGVSRAADTVDASTKRVSGGLDNAFATSTLAGAVKAEQKFLQGDSLGLLEKQKLKNRWGDGWEEYLTSVRNAYASGDEKAIKEYEQRAQQIASLYDTSPKLDAAAEQAEQAKAGLGKAGNTALDLLGMGADMAGYASLASTGGGNPAVFTGMSSIGAAGHAGDQARKMGANVLSQDRYANAVGAVNFAVERLGGIGGGKLTGNIMGRVLPQGVKNLAAKTGSTAAGRLLGGAAEEGFQGGLQNEIERRLRNQILNANEAFDPAQLLADAGMNAAMGLVFRGGQEIGRAIGPKLTRADGSPGLNVDNAAGGIYNQTNEGGGANGTGQVDNRGGRIGVPQYDSGIGVAENSAGLRGTEGGGTKTGSSAGGDSRIYSSDSEGRRIAPEVNKKLSGTAVADSGGRPVSVYHSTPNMEFTTFDQGDVGFHFGSERQAAKRQEQKGAGRMIRAYLNIKNPYRASTDIMNWHPRAAAMKLYADGVLSDSQYGQIRELASGGQDYHSKASVALREMLAEKGYDGIAYPNMFEADGDSYIALYPEQVVIADDGKGDSGDGTGANPESSVGAAESGFDPYSQMQNEHGTIPPGEQPRAREVDVPQSTDGNDRVSRFARTLMEAPSTPDEFIPALEQQVQNGLFSHKTRKDKAALKTAVSTIERNGWDGAMRQWNDVVEGNRKAGKEDIALAQVMYAEAAKVGDIDTAMKLAAEIAAEGTRAGQAVQALRLLKKTTPEGKLYYARKTVAKLQEELQIKYGDKAPNLEIDEGIANEFLTAGTDTARDAALDKLYTNIAAQLPKTFGDRLNAWRYFAMLGNPRTHIRNIVGNIAFQIPVRAKNKIGAVLEKTLPKDQRTKSIFRDAAAKEFAKADYAEMADTLSGSKYNEVQEIKSRQKLFPKPLQKAMDFSTMALDAEDAFFKKNTYINSMAEFLTARGVDVKQMDANTLEQARSYAKQEALKATFQDASVIANKLSNLERENKVAGVLVGGLVPFKRTPINIVKRGVEYSHMGLIKGLTYDLARVKSGKITATEAIDHISAGLSGTAIAALGAFLASQGLVSGEGDENDKKRNFDLAQGSQEYALNIGDYTYTIDWASPGAMPLFVGVEIWNTMQEKNKGITLSTVVDSMDKILGPAFNLTMLDGVSGAMKSASYAEENPISAVIANTVQNYAGQVVPTLFGQFARTIDDTRRTTYHDKNSPIPQNMDTFLQRQMNKIPGLSMRQPAYTDVWGRPDKTDSAALRAFENFLSPGYINKKQSTEAEQALSALYDATGDASILPSKPQKYYSVGGEKKWLTADQYLRLANEKGQTSLKQLGALVSSEAYKNMSDAERVGAVKDIYDYASAIAANKVYGQKLEGTIKTVQESGIEPGLYYGYKEMEDTLNESVESYEARDQVFHTIRDDASLTEKQKNQLYDTLLIRGTSDSQYEKYKAIGDKVTKEEYIDAMIQKQYLDAAGADIESGRATVLATEFSKYLDMMGYGGEKRAALEDTFKFFSMNPAKPKNYTYEMLAESGSKDEQENAPGLQATGISAPEYLQIKTLAGKATYEKGVSGAKLAAQAAVVSQNVENYEQYAAVMHMLGYKKIEGHYTEGGKRKPVEDSAIEPRAVNASNGWAVNPVKAENATIVSDYGPRNAPSTTYGRGSSNHGGIDIGGTNGNLDGQEADTVGDGTVTVVGYDPTGYGNYVIIDHGNGYRTLYGHLRKATVQQGAAVKAGQQIGVIGGTGNVEAPHLHLSAWKNGEPIDPATMIPGF